MDKTYTFMGPALTYHILQAYLAPLPHGMERLKTITTVTLFSPYKLDTLLRLFGKAQPT